MCDFKCAYTSCCPISDNHTFSFIRFGSRSARIFRLLLRKRHLEQKQVEDFAMIPAKEAKDMLYTLLSQNLVQLQVQKDAFRIHLFACIKILPNSEPLNSKT